MEIEFKEGLTKEELREAICGITRELREKLEQEHPGKKFTFQVRQKQKYEGKTYYFYRLHLHEEIIYKEKKWRVSS